MPKELRQLVRAARELATATNRTLRAVADVLEKCDKSPRLKRPRLMIIRDKISPTRKEGRGSLHRRAELLESFETQEALENSADVGKASPFPPLEKRKPRAAAGTQEAANSTKLAGDPWH